MSTAVVEMKPRVSLLETVADKYGMDPRAFEATLRATVVPTNCSREQFAAFLMVANQYGLNPLTKEIYAFPSRNGGIQPIVSIDGWINIVNSHPAFDGVEFDDQFDNEGRLTAVTAKVWRKDRGKPTVVTEYMAECRRGTDTWKQWPARMLRHKAMIQAARYAFGFSGVIDPDEYERMVDAGRPIPPPIAVVAADAPRTAPGEETVVWDDPPHDAETGELQADASADFGETVQAETETDRLMRCEQALADAAAKGIDALKAAWSGIDVEDRKTLKAALENRFKPIAVEADQRGAR